jgi:glyoxylase-like metal-dependent hydrolase (beta-lactamase superfamily II)
MALRFGQMTVHPLVEGRVSLDGGALFGTVPRTAWERHFTPDDRNRVSLVTRALLIECANRKILVDVGMGARWDGMDRARYGLDHQGSLDAALQGLNLTRNDITDLVLSHLHFDVAGGIAREEGGELRLSYPNATVHLQRRHWKWAHQPAEKDAENFRKQDFSLLERSGKLHLLEGATELYPGVHLFVSEGHTVGMQLVRLDGECDSDALVFCGALIPTAAHLQATWVSAYDLYPLTSVEEKRQILAQALEDGWRLFFSRDPNIAICTVKDDGSGQVVVDRVLASA